MELSIHLTDLNGYLTSHMGCTAAKGFNPSGATTVQNCIHSMTALWHVACHSTGLRRAWASPLSRRRATIRARQQRYCRPPRRYLHGLLISLASRAHRHYSAGAAGRMDPHIAWAAGTQRLEEAARSMGSTGSVCQLGCWTKGPGRGQRPMAVRCLQLPSARRVVGQGLGA
jgi:hypothetical protein